MIHYRTIDSPIGPLTLAGHGSVLTNLRMLEQTYEPSRTHWTPDPGAFSGAVDQLNAYFAGELTEFDVELDLRGTDFQQRVWKALLTIPYGETRSYGEIADQIGAPRRRTRRGIGQRPQSHRHHRPCHRVIGASGKLTGYGGGINRKRALLELEKSRRPQT